MIPEWLQAGLWGLLAGGALLVGAAVGFRLPISQRVVAGVMAFGSGVLISALSFELMEEAYGQGGLWPTVRGFALGMATFSVFNWWIGTQGAKHRKRSGTQQALEKETEGSGVAIAFGALLDGIPESMAIGLSMLAGGKVSMAMVVAIFISNIPEGLSSSAGMRQAGRSGKFVFGMWAAIAVASGLASLAGFSLFADMPIELKASITALAAGGILAMLMDTMIPEAFEGSHNFSGLYGCAGFALAFTISMME